MGRVNWSCQTRVSQTNRVGFGLRRYEWQASRVGCRIHSTHNGFNAVVPYRSLSCCSGLGAANSSKSLAYFWFFLGVMDSCFSTITCDKWILVTESKFCTKVRIRIFQVLGILIFLKFIHAFKSEKTYMAWIFDMRIGLLIMLVAWLGHSTSSCISIERCGHNSRHM